MNSKRAHTVAIHQPAYLPWLGYFERIFRSDVFVFLDSVQFEKNSFTNRNKIKTAHGEQWLTVPVKAKGHTELSIAELGIADGEPWQKKHLKAIQLNYAKARYFSELFPKLEALYASKATTLADLCFNQLRFWLGELQIEREIIRSSTMTLEKKKSALVLEICQKLNATQYLSGALGRDYLELQQFEQAGIAVSFQNYQHPIYPQLFGSFLSHLSIVDFWMNCHDTSVLTEGLS